MERVGIDDSFYDLGGDSIRSIQLIAKLRERGLDLPMVELLRQPTIRALEPGACGPVEGGGQAVPGSEPFSLLSDADRARLPADVEDAYPVAVLQAGMLFQSELDQASGMYHDATSYHLEMALDEAKLRQLLAELARRHAILRTSFDLTGYEQPLQLVHREAQVPLRHPRRAPRARAEQDALLRRLVEADRCRPFDWNRAPLCASRSTGARRRRSSSRSDLPPRHPGWLEPRDAVVGAVPRLREPAAAARRPRRRRSWPSLPPVRRAGAPVAHVRPRRALLEVARWRRWTRPAPRAPLPEGQAPVLSMRPLDPCPPLLRKVSASAWRKLAHGGVPLKTVLLAAHLRVRA